MKQSTIGVRTNIEQLKTDSSKMHLNLTERDKQYEVSLAKILEKLEIDLRSEINHMGDKLGHRVDACEKKSEGTNSAVTDKDSWSKIVSQEVDSKISSVTSEMKALQQASGEMKLDRDEQEEIFKRKNSVIIHGL